MPARFLSNDYIQATKPPTAQSMSKTELLKQQLSQRILFLDGAMGTMIQSYKLEEKDLRQG